MYIYGFQNGQKIGYNSRWGHDEIGLVYLHDGTKTRSILQMYISQAKTARYRRDRTSKMCYSRAQIDRRTCGRVPIEPYKSKM